MMVDRNNSDSPSRTEQKKGKQMSGNSEMLEPGIQMIATTRKQERRITNPNTTNIPEYTVTTSFKAANQCTHTERNGNWAGSRDLRQCMNIAAPAYDDSP